MQSTFHFWLQNEKILISLFTKETVRYHLKFNYSPPTQYSVAFHVQIALLCFLRLHIREKHFRCLVEVMRPFRAKYVPERDKNTICKKIKNATAQNSADDTIWLPDAIQGDQLSVLHACASVGVQKWPITRKWLRDETLFNRGYHHLEFHSRCNLNPVEPECEKRLYLIGPKDFIESDEEKYKTSVFDDPSNSESTFSNEHRVKTRRLTCTSAKFDEVPDGFTEQPEVFAKTWDVNFIPRKNADDPDKEPAQFVQVKNVTLEAMMEIYKFSDAFFVTRVVSITFLNLIA